MFASVQDVPAVARTVMVQLTAGSGHFSRSVSDLLLYEPFALGYAIGFAENAAHYAQGDVRNQVDPDFLHKVIGFILGNLCVADSFVSFAASKRGDRVFEGGYDAGLRDMDAWYKSGGEKQPNRLVLYLNAAQP
ncbi:MAG: hypothetical protein AAF665_09185 [Pseudomonadota bacterium]